MRLCSAANKLFGEKFVQVINSEITEAPHY